LSKQDAEDSNTDLLGRYTINQTETKERRRLLERQKHIQNEEHTSCIEEWFCSDVIVSSDIFRSSQEYVKCYYDYNS